MNAIPEAALGAILAATITGLVSLLGLIISKENKTSEFRQSWIDNLRSELSLLFAHINAIQAATESTSSRLEAWKLVQSDFLQANRCIASIRLRLNPAETRSQAILRSLDKYEELFANGAAPNAQLLVPTHKDLLDEAQQLLKAEWRRVRNGELVFQIARGTSFAILIAGLSILSFLWLRTA